MRCQGIASSPAQGVGHLIVYGIDGKGILLKTYSEAKHFKRKIETSKFAHTNYDKMLADIRSYLRGLKYNSKGFIDYLKISDESIIDLCPLPDKFEKKDKMFIQ